MMHARWLLPAAVALAAVAIVAQQPALPFPTYTVTATAVLGGYTSATFGTPAQSAFVNALVSVLGVSPSAVNVTGVADAAPRQPPTQGSVEVLFSIKSPTSDAAVSLTSEISAVTPAALLAALQSSGLTACTAVAVSVVPVAPVVVEAVDSLPVMTAESAASTVLALLNDTTFTLSPVVQNAALRVLMNLASAPINITDGTAQSITSALSVLATSAMENNLLLAEVQIVLDTLAFSQANSLVASLAALPPGAPPPAPAITSSPMIQTLVQVDPPGSSRLTTQPLTAPGSPSQFEPMPADLLPGDVVIVTQFFSLAFDPHGDGANTTGVTRLAFTTADGVPFAVANAVTPIRFTLPRVNVTGNRGQAVCSFFDYAAGTYATHGCVGLPNPSPPGHTIAFVDGFTSVNDESLAWAWRIEGPLVSDCVVKVLNCSAPATTTPRVAGVSCPTAGGSGSSGQQPGLLIYSGAQCGLVQTNNAYRCSWSNLMQAFVGTGCVASDGPTQCMCRHLTDFASALAPISVVASEAVPTPSHAGLASAVLSTTNIIIIAICVGGGLLL